MDEKRSEELAEELAEEVRETEHEEIPEEMSAGDARPWGPSDYDEHGGAGLDPAAAARPADDCAAKPAPAAEWERDE
jgi:hypothetical protein